VAIVLAVVLMPKKNEGGVVINGYDEIVENIPRGETDRILSMLAYTLGLNTGRELPEIRDIEIREGSYRQVLRDGVYETEFMVDIESLEQSYKIMSYYSLSGVGADYSYQARCVFGDDLKYGEFKCKDRISEENGMPWADPAQYELPYFDTYYQINVGESTRDRIGIEIKINMAKPISENNIRAGEMYKERGLEKIREMGFDPDDYSIRYSWAY